MMPGSSIGQMEINAAIADELLNTAPVGYVPPSAGKPRTRWARVFPALVLLLHALFFLAPLLTLARYSLQNVPAFLLGRETLFKKWSLKPLTMAFDHPSFGPALKLSLQLAVGTVAVTLLLLVPTAIWVHLRVPKARAMVEFFTVLPYMIPAIALVAGIIVIKPHARWFLNSDFSLIPFYVVLSLPFTYRSIDAGLRAIDLKTLVDASRSLGRGWAGTVLKVVIPNLRTSMISVSFLTAAVVIGEFTIADTLLKETLPRFQATFVGREPQAGYALNLLALLATTALFLLLSVLTRKRNPKRKTFEHRSAQLAAKGDLSS
ncbi:MAG: ABC transporter permease subunit [Actinomycetota bacterium]|nr:ABC transporter permease subunit [Actinomycetota bacterium]